MKKEKKEGVLLYQIVKETKIIKKTFPFFSQVIKIIEAILPKNKK